MATSINPQIAKVEVVTDPEKPYKYVVFRMKCEGYEDYLCKTAVPDDVLENTELMQQLEQDALLMYKGAIQDRYGVKE